MVTKLERPNAKAKEAYVRISPSKVRVVLNLIRGKSVHEAKDILKLTERKAAHYIEHCLNSAINNAEQKSIDSEEIFVSECFADEGVTLRRWRARARGRATRIRKRTSTITIVVSRYTPKELEIKGASGKSTSDASRQRRVQASKATTEEVAEEAPKTEAVKEVAEEAPETEEEAETTKTEAVKEVAEEAPETEEEAK